MQSLQWDFVIAPEQQRQPHQNVAALRTGEGPSCHFFLTILRKNYFLKYIFGWGIFFEGANLLKFI